MARYIAEGKESTKTLHSSSEEEEINRRLKAAGLYDHEETYEARRQLDEVLQKSKEESLNRKKVDVASWPTTTSFETSFNIVENDDEDILEKPSPPINNSAKKHGRKPAKWKLLSGDEYDEEALVPIEGTSNSTQRNLLNLQKGKHINGKKLAPTVTETYGTKMVAVSLKKEDKNKTKNPIRTQREGRGDLITPDELSDVEDVRDIQPQNLDKGRNSPKDEETVGTIDSDSDDFLATPRSKNSQSRDKSDVHTSGSKTKIATMRTLCNKYSEMLKNIEKIAPSPLPEDYDFESKGPYQRLIENEEKSKIGQESFLIPIKWGKPITLTVSNNRKRRQIFKKSTTSDTGPPVDAKIDHQDDIICDSPPASTSFANLDLTPDSPVFESGASRKRQGGSKEITEMEIDTKSPVDIIQNSSFQECPICGKSFPLSVIESHADGCINNIQEEVRPRSERIAARSVKSRNGWHDSSQWGKGSDSALERRTATPEVDASETIFDTDSNSDFEAKNGSGTKRNQRKNEVSKVKKRRF